MQLPTFLLGDDLKSSTSATTIANKEHFKNTGLAIQNKWNNSIKYNSWSSRLRGTKML